MTAPSDDPMLPASAAATPGGDEPMLPADRGRRWEMVVRLINEWWTPLRPEDGCTAEELDAAERRLGVKLPAALREFYGLCGRRNGPGDVLHVQDRFLRPDEWMMEDAGGRRILGLCLEEAGTVLWSLDPAECGAPDPPVWCFDLVRGADDHDATELQSSDFSLFALEWVVVQTHRKDTPVSAWALCDVALGRHVSAQLTPLPIAPWGWSGDGPRWRHHFFQADRCLFCICNRGKHETVEVTVNAKDRAALDAVIAQLPPDVQWDIRG